MALDGAWWVRTSVQGSLEEPRRVDQAGWRPVVTTHAPGFLENHGGVDGAGDWQSTAFAVAVGDGWPTALIECGW